MTTHRSHCPHCGGSLVFQPGRPLVVDKKRIKSMYAQGFKMQEIAKILKCSIGSVHGAVHSEN